MRDLLLLGLVGALIYFVWLKPMAAKESLFLEQWRAWDAAGRVGPMPS